MHRFATGLLQSLPQWSAKQLMIAVVPSSLFVNGFEDGPPLGSACVRLLQSGLRQFTCDRRVRCIVLGCPTMFRGLAANLAT
jgi:hypothetical protein